jgi:hypothetical protein
MGKNFRCLLCSLVVVAAVAPVTVLAMLAVPHTTGAQCDATLQNNIALCNGATCANAADNEGCVNVCLEEANNIDAMCRENIDDNINAGVICNMDGVPADPIAHAMEVNYGDVSGYSCFPVGESVQDPLHIGVSLQTHQFMGRFIQNPPAGFYGHKACEDVCFENGCYQSGLDSGWLMEVYKFDSQNSASMSCYYW